MQLAINARAVGIESVKFSGSTLTLGIKKKNVEGKLSFGNVNSAFRDYANKYRSPWSEKALENPIWGIAGKFRW